METMEEKININNSLIKNSYIYIIILGQSMNYNKVLYHGTDKSSAKKIIADNFKPSEGNNHWLGDGVYFYEEKFHAFKWEWYKCPKDKKKDKNYLKNRVAIVMAKVNCEESRVFNLDRIEHKLLFEEMYKEINTTTKLLKNLKDGACAEGVVLNYMFNKYGYIKKFDIVKALFPIPHKKYYNIIIQEKCKPIKKKTHRLTFMPEVQVCIKNTSVIDKNSLKICDINDEVVDVFIELTQKYDYGLDEVEL